MAGDLGSLASVPAAQERRSPFGFAAYLVTETHATRDKENLKEDPRNKIGEIQFAGAIGSMLAHFECLAQKNLGYVYLPQPGERK